MMPLLMPRGILLPEAVLQTEWFGVFATFMAINTIIYVVLGVCKLLPVVRLGGKRGRERRAETRSIYPDSSP